MEPTKKKFTAQGRDTSVPVLKGVVAGPAGSSSHDCKTPAMNQAGSQVSTTGTQGKVIRPTVQLSELSEQKFFQERRALEDASKNTGHPVDGRIRRI